MNEKTEQPVILDITDVFVAAERLRPFLPVTPILEVPRVNGKLGGRLIIKAESLNVTASFKVRGALNRILAMTEDERRLGVVAFSAGNHAQGLAYASSLLGIRCMIAMPKQAPTGKIEKTRGYGAHVVLYDRDRDDREALAMSGHRRHTCATLRRPVRRCRARDCRTGAVSAYESS
jgi:threonine dehydratase